MWAPPSRLQVPGHCRSWHTQRPALQTLSEEGPGSGSTATPSPPGPPAHQDPQPTWTSSPLRSTACMDPRLTWTPSPPGPPADLDPPARLDSQPARIHHPPGPPPTRTPSPPGLPAHRDPPPGTHHCLQLLVVSWPGVYRCPCNLQPHWLTGTQPPPVMSSCTVPATAGHVPLGRPESPPFPGPQAHLPPTHRPLFGALWTHTKGPASRLRVTGQAGEGLSRGEEQEADTVHVCAHVCARVCVHVCAHVYVCICGGGRSQSLCSFSLLSPAPPPPASSPSGQKQPSMRCSSQRLLTSRCEQVSMQGEPLSR